MFKHTAAVIIFDNGGGTTLQLGQRWAHWYADANQAAQDFLDFAEHGDTSEWEGHEPESLSFDPSLEEVRNGGCRILYGYDVEAALDTQEFSWVNEHDFMEAVCAGINQKRAVNKKEWEKETITSKPSYDR